MLRNFPTFIANFKVTVAVAAGIAVSVAGWRKRNYALRHLTDMARRESGIEERENIAERWKEKHTRERPRECVGIYTYYCCCCGSPLLDFSFVLLMTHGADIQAAGRVRGGRGDWVCGQPQKKNYILYIHKYQGEFGANCKRIRKKQINWNFDLIEMFATVSIMRRGGAAERGRLAKVAVRSHWRCSTLSLSLSFTLSRTLAFSPSITLFADHHHHRHTINSVFVCVY